MLRPYNVEDKAQLIDIFKCNTPQYFDPKEVQDFEDYLEKYLETYQTVLYDGKIVGGIGYYFKEGDNSGRITWIFFHPNYAGLGLGKQSVEYCIPILKANPKVQKLVVSTSQWAFGFFEKFGYKLIYTEKDHWGEGLDLYLMEKLL
jgi:ribosomal protein S18 acetylase RimI-like enzyme